VLRSAPRAPVGSAAVPATPVARGAALTVLAAALGVAGWLLVKLLGFDYGLDQGIYAAVAEVMASGGVPYRDAWDFKPPGIFLAYGLARGVFGSGIAAARGLEALAWLSLLPAFALLSRRFAGSVLPGLLGAALAVSGHVWLGFWHTGQPESFGAVLLAWALVLACVEARAGDVASQRRQTLAWVASGALYALAASMKPPLGGGVLVSAGFAAHAAWRRTPPAARARARARAAGRPLLAFGGGALALLLFIGVGLGLAGALSELHEALFVFAPEYTRLNYRSGNPVVFAFRAIEFLLFRFSLLNPLGLLLLFALPPLAPREREGAAHVLGVLGFVLAGVALQGRFFAYHYGAAVPLLALLAGFGLWKLTRVGERIAFGVVLLALALVTLANANGLKEPVEGSLGERLRHFDDGRTYTQPLRGVADWIAGHTAPDDALYVWGFQPMLYPLSERRPASRYVYNAPQRAAWYAQHAKEALMAELEADPPEAIAVEQGDVHPGTTGNAQDSTAALEQFPRLRRFLEAYEPAARLGAFTIYLRRVP
jgi:hypothetical protein